MTANDLAFIIGVCFALIIAVVIGAVAIVYMIHGILSIIKELECLGTTAVGYKTINKV